MRRCFLFPPRRQLLALPLHIASKAGREAKPRRAHSGFGNLFSRPFHRLFPVGGKKILQDLLLCFETALPAVQESQGSLRPPPPIWTTGLFAGIDSRIPGPASVLLQCPAARATVERASSFSGFNWRALVNSSSARPTVFELLFRRARFSQLEISRCQDRYAGRRFPARIAGQD